MKVTIRVDSNEAEWFASQLETEIPQRDAQWHIQMEWMIRETFLKRVQEQLPAKKPKEGALAPTPVDPEVAKLLAAADASITKAAEQGQE